MNQTIEREARPRPFAALERELWDIAARVVDPEVPVLTIEDLGVLRTVSIHGDAVSVQITPTYSGCPAVDAIRDDIVSALAAYGHPNATVTVVLSPAWTTEWMSDAGRDKLAEYGIAPPLARVEGNRVSLGLGIRCPHCGSMHTRAISQFGSTSCKALYVCQKCQEPFDYFKAH